MTGNQQANVDPEALRTLSSELSTLATKIEQMDNDLRGALAQLGRTFRDDEFDRFESHFRNSTQRLKAFVEAIHRLTPRLDEKMENLLASQRVKIDL